MKSNNTVLVALFAALIVVLSLVPPIPLPAIPVPVTLQTLGAMLAGAMLPVRGRWPACCIWRWRPSACRCCRVDAAGWGLPGADRRIPDRHADRRLCHGLAGAPAGGPGAWHLGRRGGLCGRLRGRWHRGGVCLRRAWLASVAKMDLGKAALAVAVFVPGDLIKAAVAAWRRAWRASGPCRAVEARGRTHEDRNPQLTHGGFPVQVRH